MPNNLDNAQALAFDDIVSLLKGRYLEVIQIRDSDVDPELVKLGGRVYGVKVTDYFGFVIILLPPTPSSMVVQEFAFLCDTDLEVQEELVAQINNKLEWVQAVLVPENEGDTFGHLSFFASGGLKEGIGQDEFHHILDYWQHELAIAVELATSNTYEEKGEPSAAILNTFKSKAVRSFMTGNDARKALSSGNFSPRPERLVEETPQIEKEAPRKRFGLF